MIKFIYLLSNEDLLVFRRSLLLLRDFDDNDSIKFRSFELLFLRFFVSDLSLYLRLNKSSLDDAFSLR